MSEFILNPRRAPRATVRCEARIALRDGRFFLSPTGDYGPRGCQVLAPEELAPGTRLFVELVNERVPEAVELTGRIAWTSTEPPWRMGIAFDSHGVLAATDFFEQLAAAYPGIDTSGRAPDRIPADAPLAPAPPPPFDPALSDDEARVLDALGPGARAGALRLRLDGRWAGAQQALFSLLGRRYVALGPPDEAAARAWRALREGRREVG